jgi:hypothetical protein
MLLRAVEEHDKVVRSEDRERVLINRLNPVREITDDRRDGRYPDMIVSGHVFFLLLSIVPKTKNPPEGRVFKNIVVVKIRLSARAAAGRFPVLSFSALRQKARIPGRTSPRHWM